MGYYSRIEGFLEFNPPMTKEEYEKFDAWQSNEFVLLEPEVEPFEDTDTLVPITDDSVKAYRLNAQLETILRLLPDRKWSGSLEVTGECGDKRLYFVEDGKVVEWEAVLLWPDGSTEKIRP